MLNSQIRMSKVRPKRAELVHLEDHYYASYHPENTISCTRLSESALNSQGYVKIGSIAIVGDISESASYISLPVGDRSVFLIKSADRENQMQKFGLEIASCQSYPTIFEALSRICSVSHNDCSLFLCLPDEQQPDGQVKLCPMTLIQEGDELAFFLSNIGV